MPDSSSSYRACAAECLRLAKDALHPDSKTQFEQLAQKWLERAAEAEKFERLAKEIEHRLVAWFEIRTLSGRFWSFERATIDMAKRRDQDGRSNSVPSSMPQWRRMS
jgi:hypothetical protein